MADYDSSLPMRTEAAGDVDVFISDATTPSQKLKVNADGSIDTSLAAGTKMIITDGVDDVAVNGDGSINVVTTATDLDIRNLLFATDKVDVTGSEVSLDAATLAALETTTVVATDLDIRSLVFATDKVDVTGSEVSLDAATLAALETTTVIATDLDIRNLVFATDKVDVSGSSNVGVTATDFDIRDLSASQDSVAAHLFDEAGVAYSPTNPMPVEMVSDQAGDEICDYNTSASVAKNASVNHDYTVTALKTFLGQQAWISGSGKLKAEVLIDGATVFVGFNSASDHNIEIPMDKICKAAAGEVVRITITNLDNGAQDVYSTLTGLEI